MKSVGKQLQDARVARKWTPELAARETKIKVDRLRDLEADDYTHFSSPTYARGFVRTYARALGLDEYKILRQLDNKLPDDDTSNIVTESGVTYLPETSMPARVAHRDFAGLYVVLGLGFSVVLVIVFVLFEAYRVGDLPRYFAHDAAQEDTGTSTETNNAPALTDAETVPHALPVDPSDTSHAPKAQPVDLSAVAPETNAAPAVAVAPAASDAEIPAHALKALPVNPADLANPPSATTATTAAPLASTDTKTPPRALPVDLSELTAAPASSPETNSAPVETPAPGDAIAASSPTTAKSSLGPVIMPSLPPVSSSVADSSTNSTTSPDATDSGKPLILTASQDSFVRVTLLDTSNPDKPLYASVLHSGQSVGFDGHKFSVNVGIPSAVDIKLDGVNYGPHSDQESPETFTVESHLQ